MLNCENIMLVGLVSIIVIIVVLMYQKNSAGSGNNRNLDVLNNFLMPNIFFYFH